MDNTGICIRARDTVNFDVGRKAVDKPLVSAPNAGNKRATHELLPSAMHELWVGLIKKYND